MMYALWGLVIIASGIFVTVYGNILFRFALAALGFGIGAILAWWVTAGQADPMRILISVAVGGVLAFVFYALVRIGIYVAGGALGLVLAFLLIALLGLGNMFVDITLLVAGAGAAAYWGPRLGQKIISVATAVAGAFQVVYGLAMLFGGSIAPDASPVDLLGTPLALTIFLIVAAIGVLSQIGPRTRLVRVAR